MDGWRVLLVSPQWGCAISLGQLVLWSALYLWVVVWLLDLTLSKGRANQA